MDYEELLAEVQKKMAKVAAGKLDLPYDDAHEVESEAWLLLMKVDGALDCLLELME